MRLVFYLVLDFGRKESRGLERGMKRRGKGVKVKGTYV
jgi:hypothetical protein